MTFKTLFLEFITLDLKKIKVVHYFRISNKSFLKQATYTFQLEWPCLDILVLSGTNSVLWEYLAMFADICICHNMGGG